MDYSIELLSLQKTSINSKLRKFLNDNIPVPDKYSIKFPV